MSLRDRADTETERAEALLLGIERAYAQQMASEAVDLGELRALAEAAAAESDTSRRLAEKPLRVVRAMAKDGGLLVRLPKLVNAERMLAAPPTLSDAAATVRRAVPRAWLTTLARDLTEALGQLALAASQRPVNQDDIWPPRSVFARLDGLPLAHSGVRERLGVALTEIEGR